MNKLSKVSLEKIKIFLDDKKYSCISLTRHEFKILFNIYNSVIRLISEAEGKEERLIEYLEDKINKRNNEIENANLGIDMLYFRKGLVEAYQDILEKVKGGKYE